MAKKPAPAFEIPADEGDRPEGPPPKPAGLTGHPVPEGPALPPANRNADNPYKVGKRNLSVYVAEAAHRQFKALAAEDGVTVQDYLCALLNREFERRGKPPLA